jgi:hypothetical protein
MRNVTLAMTSLKIILWRFPPGAKTARERISPLECERKNPRIETNKMYRESFFRSGGVYSRRIRPSFTLTRRIERKENQFNFKVNAKAERTKPASGSKIRLKPIVERRH